MNEQMISQAVAEVLRGMNSGHDAHHHECKCKKHKMTLALAKSLIEKVEQKAKEIDVNTKTFFPSSMSDTTTAQAIIEWIKA